MDGVVREGQLEAVRMAHVQTNAYPQCPGANSNNRGLVRTNGQAERGESPYLLAGVTARNSTRHASHH